MHRTRDELLAGNAAFLADGWDATDADMAAKPAKGLAILACMDTRYNVEKVLGLQHGDAKIIRNAGAVVDDGALRSLIVAVHLLGVDEIAVMGHTKCGMTMVGTGDFTIAHSIHDTTDVSLGEVMRPDFQRWLGGFADSHDNVRRGVELLRKHPYIPDSVGVYGVIYDNETGKVEAVE